MSLLSKLTARTAVAPFAAVLHLAVASGAPAATPEKGHVAVGGSFGLYAPFESSYKLGFALEGSIEYFLSRRIGIRGTAGYGRSSTKFFNEPSASDAYFLASGVHNWELGSIHPFALGGVGLYAVSPAVGGSTARVGGHVGGGAELFLNRRTSIPAQGTFHFLGGVADQRQSFFNATAGIRYYF